MIFWILFFLTSNCSATSPDAPFFVREMKDQHDVAAMNENFRSMSDYVRQLGNTVSTDAGGDVTAAGNNTFTGNNIMNGKNQISTGAIVNFSSSLGWTTTATSFIEAAGVTGSTISFTVAGTTVSCWLVGGIYTTLNGGQDINFGIGVDGLVNVIPGTSGSVGVMAMSGHATSTGRLNASFGPIEFQVTSGSHTFWLGIWGSNSGTTTFPGNSIGQFGCREVPSR